MFNLIAATAVALSAFSSVSNVEAKLARGMAWATDNNYAKNINKLPLITWMHHWENMPVPQAASRIEQIAMYWGPKKKTQWYEVLTYLKKHDPSPSYLFSFNEPDVSSQGNLPDASKAASIFMQQIQPFANKGTKLGSPAIVYNLKWMGNFLDALTGMGGHIDFICIHWYGSYKDLAGFQNYVKKAHELSKKPVWILEMGVTTGCNPSQRDVKNFMIKSISWLETQSYVERVAWHGGYEINNPPDNYASKYNALFKRGGALSDMMYWYGYTKGKGKRTMNSHHLHRTVEEDDVDVDVSVNATISAVEAIHCDEICKLRNENIDFVASI